VDEYGGWFVVGFAEDDDELVGGADVAAGED
jgi:hypothetical protein